MTKFDIGQFKVVESPYYEEQFNEVDLYKVAYDSRLPVMMKGPTGCGKSRFIEHMAYNLDKPIITVSCNEDITASDLIGRFLLDSDGTRWIDGPLTVAARHGAICYLDEVVEEKPKAKKQTRAQAKVEQAPEPTAKEAEEFGDDQEWIEDDNGNFVPKGE